jgi:hypothetical protein
MEFLEMSRRIETGTPAQPAILGSGVGFDPDATVITEEFRITQRGLPAAGATPAKEGDDYLDRLVKYIPSEIIALYLGVTNVAPADHWRALWIITILSVVCVPIYMYYATLSAGKPLWSQVLISSIAFPIWVFAIGGPFRYFHNWYPQNRWIAAVIISFSTFLLGVYKPKAAAPASA